MSSFVVDIELFNLGDRHSFDKIYQCYSRSLIYFALSFVNRRELAEELVSDSMLKLWHNRKRIENNSQIKAFLFIATKNACIDALRSKRSLPLTAMQEQAYDLAGEDPTVYSRILHTELLLQIEQALEKLPMSQQLVFRRSILEGMTTDEIVNETGMTTSSVFSQKSKAIQTLRRILKHNLLLLLFLTTHGL